MRTGLFLVTLLFVVSSFGQRVGVVFSGGGATGFAHVGVLKALEEHDIPIDFITGTSAGALVGGLYASGFSAAQIEVIVLSRQFALMSSGEIEDIYDYYITRPEQDAEMMSFRFAKDSIFQKSLPTNLLNPTYLDFELLHLLGLNPPESKRTFDSLFVPFRCNASDIVTKQPVVFRSGDLNVAVRASMTYPFFISPIEVDGKLLFDGGLYNNFPANDMYNEFNPDYIIGSNVSYNEAAPTDDNLMSQIKNMFSFHSLYQLPCEQGVIIEPDLGDIGTFDFDRIEEAIQIGYDATIAKIDSIKMQVQRRVTKEERTRARALYQSRMDELAITQVEVHGFDGDQGTYVTRKLVREKNEDKIDYQELKKRYLRLYQSEHILSIFPTVVANSDSTQTLTLAIRPEKAFRMGFGGHYSSRPVNTGFLSLSYSDFKLTPVTLYGNTYFGKFYGSVKAGLKYYLPMRATAFLEPQFVMNRWDYFKSFSTFFEDVKPSYIVQNETFWSLAFHAPLSSRTKLSFDFTNGLNEDTYYQSEDFTKLDTSDYTSLLYYSPGIEFSMNSLNRRQFASAGMQFSIRSRFIHGIEHTVPGSTALDKTEVKTIHNWAYVTMKYQAYFMRRGPYRLGMLVEGHYSFQPFFQNYTASLLSAHAFQPTPDSKTGFYNDYRANQYLAGGLMNVFTFNDVFDLRLEAYIFQPVRRIVENEEDGSLLYGNYFEDRFGLASVSLIYHSVIGPFRATVNYYDSKTELYPLSFQVSFGYVIFNRNGIK